MELLLIWVVCGIIAAAVASSKGRSAFVWFLGVVFLTPLMLIILLCLPEIGRQCLECKGVVAKDATKCKHCGSMLQNV